MDTLDSRTWTLVAALVVLLLIAVAGAIAWRRHRSQRLHRRFGSEYDRTVAQYGSRHKAESELQEREKRVEKLNIVPLSPAEAARFFQAWQALQSRFIDDPRGSVAQADVLVRELMAKRGYPMTDFEHRAADISVDHPDVVEHYRAAKAIAQRDERGEAGTEDLRNAVVHYRALFDELCVAAGEPERISPRRPPHQHIEVRS